jgi:hypothetical protein
MKRDRSRLFRFFAVVLVVLSLQVAALPGFGATPVPLNATQPGGMIQPQGSQLKVVPQPGAVVRVPATQVDDGRIMNVASPTGQGMYLGTTVKIQWEWRGATQYLADVTLWDESVTGNPRQVATIATGRTQLWTNWEIPYTFPAGFYTIRVTSAKNPGNSSDYRIKVMNGTITVTSPNSSFTLGKGSTYSIWWTYQGRPGPVKIELTNTAGSAPLVIIANTPGGELGVGKFDWTVPTTLADASNYLVRVTSLVSPSITGASQPFSVAPPSITITTPQTGKEFLPAVYVPIRWTSVGNNFGTTVHVTAWPYGGSGMSLDLQCPLSQRAYDQWMPVPLEGKQSFYIRIESTQNRSIAHEVGPITILPRQSQAPNTDTSPSGASK